MRPYAAWPIRFATSIVRTAAPRRTGRARSAPAWCRATAGFPPHRRASARSRTTPVRRRRTSRCRSADVTRERPHFPTHCVLRTPIGRQCHHIWPVQLGSNRPVVLAVQPQIHPARAIVASRSSRRASRAYSFAVFSVIDSSAASSVMSRARPGGRTGRPSDACPFALELPAVGCVAADRLLQDLPVGQLAAVDGHDHLLSLAAVRLPAVEPVDQHPATRRRRSAAADPARPGTARSRRRPRAAGGTTP